MPLSDEERSDRVRGGGGKSEVGGGVVTAGKDDDGSENACEECGKKKDKRVALFRFRKAKKKLLIRLRKKASSVANTIPGCGGNKVFIGRGGGSGGDKCNYCLKRPLTSEDTPGESATSDPNSPAFTYDMLTALIEKNDFYSQECNPHLNVNVHHVSNEK